MAIRLTAESTYSIGTSSNPSTLVDENGNAIDLSAATVKYVLTTQQGGGDVVLTITDSDSEWTTVNASAGEFAIQIPAADVPEGTHYEEFRVDTGGTSIVALVDGNEPQREVYFRKVATSP